VSFGLLGIPTASAITWDFSTPPGADGTSQNFTVGGVTLTAAGFSNQAALLANTPNVNLFGKNAGVGETGLGLVNDPTGDNEISGNSLIRIAMAAGLTDVMFQMNSTTAGETWRVFGFNSATGPIGAPLLTGIDQLSHSVPFFSFYAFDVTVGNVLLGSISAVPGPIVGGGLPSLVVASVGLLALARRRRKANRLSRS